MNYHFPLFRPPSEGDNLIIQATLGCRYNQCSFCSMYKTKTYRARTLAEIGADIDQAAREWPEAHRVFLADGDAFTLPTDHLAAVLDKLAASFPALRRVSAYATPRNILDKSPGELALLRAGRLTLVYVGLETGSNALLKRIAKGATADHIAAAFAKARESRLKVSATVILGVGGRHHWRDHVEATAALVNRAPPNFLSTLQLTLEPAAVPRFLERFEGTFEPQDDDGMLAEQEALIAALDPPAPVIFRSNHASNALPLAGTLPKDRDRLLAQLAAGRSGQTRLRPRLLRGL